MLLIVKNYYEQQKKDYKIRALTQMGSYYNLMPEETFLPTAIFLKFWVVFSTTFEREFTNSQSKCQL